MKSASRSVSPVLVTLECGIMGRSWHCDQPGGTGAWREKEKWV